MVREKLKKKKVEKPFEIRGLEYGITQMKVAFARVGIRSVDGTYRHLEGHGDKVLEVLSDLSDDEQVATLALIIMCYGMAKLERTV